MIERASTPTLVVIGELILIGIVDKVASIISPVFRYEGDLVLVPPQIRGASPELGQKMRILPFGGLASLRRMHLPKGYIPIELDALGPEDRTAIMGKYRATEELVASIRAQQAGLHVPTGL